MNSTGPCFFFHYVALHCLLLTKAKKENLLNQLKNKQGLVDVCEKTANNKLAAASAMMILP